MRRYIAAFIGVFITLLIGAWAGASLSTIDGFSAGKGWDKVSGQFGDSFVGLLITFVVIVAIAGLILWMGRDGFSRRESAFLGIVVVLALYILFRDGLWRAAWQAVFSSATLVLLIAAVLAAVFTAAYNLTTTRGGE